MSRRAASTLLFFPLYKRGTEGDLSYKQQQQIPPAPLFTRKGYAGGCPAATQRPCRSQRGEHQ